MNNDMPISIKLDNAKKRINAAVSSVIMEYGLPAFLMQGVLAEVMLDIKEHSHKEVVMDYIEMLEKLKKGNSEDNK